MNPNKSYLIKYHVGNIIFSISEGTDAEIQPKISASELLSLLGNLANEFPQGQKRQMRFGLF